MEHRERRLPVLADNLQPDKISEIRERKGMKQELNPAIDYF